MSKLSAQQLTEWLQTLKWEEVETRVQERGLLLLPALVDAHVHFRVPGAEHKEDWETGSEAAVQGGLCGVVDMPNTSPPTFTKKELEEKIQIVEGQKKHGLRSYFYVACQSDAAPDPSCAEFAVGVKVYYGSSTGNLLTNTQNTLEQLYTSWPRIITIHAESEEVIQKNLEQYTDRSNPSVHSKIRSREAAVQATKELIEIVRKHKKPTIFAHVSTKEEIELLSNAKQEGLPVHIEVTPHHLFLNDSDYEQWENYVRVNPPLRTEEDNRALWQAITDGVVDYIGTDHAPHTSEEKELEYDEAPSGIPEIDTVVPLMLNAINEGKLTIELMHTNPIRLFDLHGLEQCGVVVDMSKQQNVKQERINSKCGWSPYVDWELQGWPIYTIIDNNVITINN